MVFGEVIGQKADCWRGSQVTLRPEESEDKGTRCGHLSQDKGDCTERVYERHGERRRGRLHCEAGDLF